MDFPRRQWLGRALGLLLLPSGVMANDYFDAGLSVTSAYTDNATRTEEDQISERQDEYQLSLGTDYSNDLVELEAEYNARHDRFAKDTQPSRNSLEGNTRLLIGKPHHSADLLLTHSRRRILRQPDEVDLLANNDERDVFTAAPTLRWHASSVDAVLLRGNASTIDYRYDEGRNSDRVGASLVWQHDFSTTDRMELTVSQNEVSFEVFPAFDYTYQAARLGYSVDLRQLSYTVELGYNTTEPEDGEDFSGPSYLVDINYDSGLNQFSFSASQFITDSSQGSGNQGELGGFGSGRDTVDEVDQLERFQVELRWDNRALCGRCNLYVDARYQTDDYRLLSEDTDEAGVGAGLDYRLSTSSTIGVNLTGRTRSFETGATRSDFDTQRARINYSYGFVNDMNLGLFALYEERDSEGDGRDYDEVRGGITLGYTF